MSLELHRFLKYYNPYVNNEWRNHYFSYDSLKAKYKTIKEQHDNSHPDTLNAIVLFEQYFLNEIQSVYRFLTSICHDIDTDLVILLNSIEKNKEQQSKQKNKEKEKDGVKEKAESGKMSSSAKKKQSKALQEQHDRTIEISLRSLYDKIKDVELFYHLNYYSICKISKKLEKLLQIYHVMVDSTAIHLDIGLSGRAGIEQGISKPESEKPIHGASSMSLNSELVHNASFTQGNGEHRRFNFPVMMSGIGVISMSLGDHHHHAHHQVQQQQSGNNISAKEDKLNDLVVDTTGTQHAKEQSDQRIEKPIGRTSPSSISDELDNDISAIAARRLKPRTGSELSIRSNHSSGPSTARENVGAIIPVCSDSPVMKVYFNRDIKDVESKIGYDVNSDPPSGVDIGNDDGSVNSNKNEKNQKEKQKTWEDSESGIYFFETFTPAIDKIEDLKQRCIDVYSKKFRITYSQLASYELEFVKNKDRVYESTNFMLGLKIGLIVCLVLLFILDTNTIHEDLNFWDQPGLYVYTTIGNLLLYRVFWWVNIAIWAKYDVNYISILQLSDVKPNLLLVADQTATLLALYFIDLLIFYRANTSYSSLDNTFLSFSSPIVLVGLAILYQWYEYLFLFGDERISRGLFNKQVIRNCFSAPFVKVTFRDNYSADVLTSFTRILADSLYASCWVMSGSFVHPTSADSGSGNSAHSFGSDYMHCTGNTMFLLAGYVQIVPLFIRMLQCCRNLYDATPNWRQFSLYPQGFNAIKYLLSILVVLATVDTVGLGFTSTEFNLFLIVVTTLYKWWWDVAMDWGLFDVMPRSPWDLMNINTFTENHMFLRKSLMYPSALFYYICIILDLVLRFMWVLSLLPPEMFGSFVGYQLKLFIGSMEILRRCMWGILRVEYEHLKMLRNKTPGFLSNRFLRRSSRTNGGVTSNQEEALAMTQANGNYIAGEESSTGKTFNSDNIANMLGLDRDSEEDDRHSHHDQLQQNDSLGGEEIDNNNNEPKLSQATNSEKHELIEQLRHLNKAADMEMRPPVSSNQPSLTTSQLLGSSSTSCNYSKSQRGLSIQGPPSLIPPTEDDVSAFSEGMRSPQSSQSPFRRRDRDREAYSRDIEAYGSLVHYDSDDDDDCLGRSKHRN